jgi:hypothetical protein
MGDSKNLKKNGQSQLSSRYNKRVGNRYHNNNQHIEYYHFIKTARLLQTDIEGIFGRTHIDPNTSRNKLQRKSLHWTQKNGQLEEV